MTRKAINAWYDPDADTDIAEWDASCTNRSAYTRDAIREKIQRRQAAETREQGALDRILVEVAETRKMMDRIVERWERILEDKL